MKVAYSSPFVPPEWIAAHRLRPVWLPDVAQPVSVAQRGVCRCASLLLKAALEQSDIGAFVVTTVCDQMRYAAGYLQVNGGRPVFLMNVPSTWQAAAVKQLYRDELSRLGRFLESLGGTAPTDPYLQLVMQRFAEPRCLARSDWPAISGMRYAGQLAALRDAAQWDGPLPVQVESTDAIPLALVGGPLLADDFVFVDLVTKAGGGIVLDASEWGERTLPGELDRSNLMDDPLGELARIYFAEIPDVFRRPNTELYRWLGEQITLREIRGILFWRRLFCDLWHAELDVLRRWSPVPVLDIDVAEGDGYATARTLSRLEAFLEMLQ